jgi:hypothetical protein
MVLRPDTLSQTDQAKSQNRLQTGRAIRFKSRGGFPVLRMMTRPRRELAKAHGAQFAAQRLLGN